MAFVEDARGFEWPTVMKKEDWKYMWDVQDIGFHETQVHPDVLKHENLFLKPNSRVYMPLCGKSVDLIYLADQGYDVVGCELVERAVLDFFKDQKLEYSISKDPTTNVSIYKANSKNIKIYQGDFFVLTSSIIGKFDAIWDRGALVAINKADQEKYVEVLKDVMAPNCKSLINLISITGKDYLGPPHSMNVENIKKLFGESYELRQVDATQFEFDLPLVEAAEFINVLLN